MGTRSLKLFDLVAVLHALPDEGVQVGDVGTVVELLAPDAVEVEFLGADGHTRAVATLQTNDILLLNRERTPVP